MHSCGCSQRHVGAGLLCYSPPHHLPCQLLSLAVGTQDLVTLLVEKKSATVPAVNRDVIEKFYPLLADLILEVCAQAPYTHFALTLSRAT